jgi:hypothetical protein
MYLPNHRAPFGGIPARRGKEVLAGASGWCRKSARIDLGRVGIAIVLFLAALAGPARAQPGDKRDTIDFAHDIVPILKKHCAECHTSGKYKGGLSLETRDDIMKSGALVPGKSAASEIIKRVTATKVEERMPLKKPALSANEISLLRNWIDTGASWEAGFTFKISTYVAPLKPRRPVVPPGRPGLQHPIDRLLEPYFAKHKVTLVPLDDVSFVRRVFLDLIGLLPLPAEAEAFSKDETPDKRARLAGRLLQETRPYAEHWLSFWNDLLRNDHEGTGYIDGGRKEITDWLYRSLLENKPYDRFVRELLNPAAESEGFIKGIIWRGKVNASQVPELQFAQNVSQVFFGANLKCASCHDSFIDNWKLEDSYGMAAIYANKPLEIYRCDVPTGKKAAAHFLFRELGDVDATKSREERLARLADLATHADNGRFPRTIANRIWQRLLGRGLVHPVDIMGNEPWSADLLDYLATYLVDNHYDIKKLMEHIVTSRAYQSRPAPQAKAPSAGEYVFHGPELRRLTVEQFLDGIWMITGTAPVKANVKLKLPAFTAATPVDRRFIRAALVNSDLLMRSLGRPNREQVLTVRPDELSTLQALDLANGQILADTLARGAKNIMMSANDGAEPDELIDGVYRKALCRLPGLEERRVAREIVGSPATAEGVADLLWTVFMLPEFQLIR